MSGRKVLVLWVSVVLLSVSLGTVVTGEAAASNHTEFRVINAELGDSSILEGESVEVSATVQNTGVLLGAHTVELQVDGEVRAERRVSLFGGQSTTISFTESFDEAGSYAIAASGVDAGTLSVESEPDAGDNASEADDNVSEANETESEADNDVSGPDIAVTDAATERSEILENESVEVTALLENSGNVSGSLGVELLVDGDVNEQTEVSVGPNGNETVTFTFEPPGPGEHDLSVNGVDAGTVTVEAAAEPTVTGAELGTDEILDGESVEITATVENAGDGGGEHTAVLYVDGESVDSETISLPPRETGQVNFNRTFDRAGEYNLTVDSTNVGVLTVEATNSTEDESGSSSPPGNPPIDDNTTDDSTDGNITDDNSTDDNTTDDNSGQSEPENSESANSGSSGSSNSGGQGSANSGSSGSSNSGGSASSSSSDGGSNTRDDTEPTVTRTADTVAIRVDESNGDSVVGSIDLAGPSEVEPAVSLSILEIDPDDREPFEMTVARPAAAPGETPTVPHGSTLAYVALETDPGVEGTANLSFELDRAAIPDGLGTEDVRVMRYAGGEWTTDGVTHDVGGEEHHAILSGASPVAVVALEPGTVEVVETGGLVDWVRAGHETTARVSVRNPGDRPATRTLTIATNGETVAERDVSLDPGETATVEIAFEPKESGAVTLNGTEMGTLTIGSGDDDRTAEDPGTVENMDGFDLLSVAFALLVVTVAARTGRS